MTEETKQDIRLIVEAFWELNDESSTSKEEKMAAIRLQKIAGYTTPYDESRNNQIKN